MIADNNKSGTSLVGCCVAIGRDSCRNWSRLMVDDEFRLEIRSLTTSCPDETSNDCVHLINRVLGKNSAQNAI